MSKKSVRTLALWASLLAALPAAHAGLVGDAVTGSLATAPNNWGVVTQTFGATATVGAGTEFTGQWTFAPGGVTSEVWDISVDIGADTLTVSVFENSPGSNNLYMYDGTMFSLALGDLDFGTPITGLSLIAGTTGFTAGFNGVFYSDTSTVVDADSVGISFHNLRFGGGDTGPNGGSWTWRILPSGDNTPTNGVPEPGSAALAGLALLGLAWSRRRA